MASPAPGSNKLADILERDGLHAALGWLNARTEFRYTGVYRFDLAVLRNVGLFDRCVPDEPTGADASIGLTYCAISGRLNDVLLISDGPRDRRYPWMRGNSVLSYCGVPIRSEYGHALGTLCHFDVRPCDARSEEATYLLCVADLFRPLVLEHAMRGTAA